MKRHAFATDDLISLTERDDVKNVKMVPTLQSTTMTLHLCLFLGYEYLQPASSPPSTAGHYEWLVLPILIVALIISICIVKKFKKTSLSKSESFNQLTR